MKQHKHKKKLGFIGFGNMAEAIAAGLINKKIINPNDMLALELNPKRAKAVQKKYKINIATSIESLFNQTHTIFLCVKPQNIPDILPTLRNFYNNQLMISVVTGIKTKNYLAHLGPKAKIIRVMPNTPALIGHGTAAYFAHKNVSATHKKKCEQYFNSVGTIIPIKNEALIDVVTALSGSGPAFVYQFAQSLINSGIKLGLPAKTAKHLVLQTLEGATQMMKISKDSPQQLTNKVTSKGGTTLAGLSILNKKGFTKTVEACIVGATKRAGVLSRLFKA
ncbi:pyrroline-5-carboxylate reductase [bacterium K02(2017)]|nr:pyrroline-5-carboxylate reductase [bacterium K02(2017)]